jgi:signal recognition particle subunit SRP54
MGKIPGMKNLAMARNMRRAMKSGKLPPGMGMPGGMPGMPGMPGGLPGMPGGFPGMGLPGMPGMGLPGMSAEAGEESNKIRTLSRSEKSARKNQRKRARTARKRNRGKK